MIGRVRRSVATAYTLVRAGVLAPNRPDRTVRQLAALRAWGPTIAGGYLAAAAAAPRRVAVVDETGESTFAEVDARTNRLAHGLAGLGVRAPQRVGVLCRNHGGMVDALVACAKLGADAVLLNTGMAARQLREVIGEHDLRALLADAEFGSAFDALPGDVPRVATWDTPPVGVPSAADLAAGASGTRLDPPERPGRLVVLTSGTTGTPKGAKRPTPKGLGDAAAVLSRIPLRGGDRMMIAAPLFHTWGLAGLQLGMSLRATLVLRRRFDPEETLRAIARHRCRVLFAVPVMLQRILDLPAEVRARYDTRSLRVVATSGSALAPGFTTAFGDAFGDVLYDLYGSTEVSWASIATPADLRAAPATSGRAPLGTRLAILDDAGAPVPTGHEGRVFVGNDMLFDGYTNGTGGAVDDGLMATGDRGHLDAAGRLFISGRDDDMIVSGGENAFPRPVEESIAGLPGVREVAVLGVPHPDLGHCFAAYVVANADTGPGPDAIRARVRAELAGFQVPRHIVYLDELPRNATGKVLKRNLPPVESAPL